MVKYLGMFFTIMYVIFKEMIIRLIMKWQRL